MMLAAQGREKSPVVVLSLAVAAWLGAAWFTATWPDNRPYELTAETAIIEAGVSVVLLLALLAWSRLGRVSAQIGRAAPWLLAIPLGLLLWEALTAKFELLPHPFFVPPQALLSVYAGDYPKLAESLYESAKLLAAGFFLGAATGFVTGVSVAWTSALGYWVNPFIRFLGPIPSTALLPLAFFFFPSSWSGSVFLIALATWFPVTVLTWSGVASVNKSYYDVARTLGANQSFLVLKVAVPASLPHVFVGLFMGLGASFSVLVVAEMMGVKAGLGYYLQWAQGWAAYNNMYAALALMSVVFSGLITLLFRGRDHLLAWQKGVVKW
jgi:NitT/TauT family transport system permease protein